MKQFKYKWMEKLFGDHSRWLHFLIMFMVSIWLVWWIGFGVIILGMLVGVGKELWDKYKRGKHFDLFDAKWTVIGSLMAWIIYKILT